jgi:hypothetical protein
MATSDHVLWERNILFNYFDKSKGIDNDPVLLPAGFADETVFQHAVGVGRLKRRPECIKIVRDITASFPILPIVVGSAVAV